MSIKLPLPDVARPWVMWAGALLQSLREYDSATAAKLVELEKRIKALEPP